MSYIKSTNLVTNRMLKAERKRRGWTQAWLARALGVTTRTVIRWEQGLVLPQPTHRMQLESLFGKMAEELGLFWNNNENTLTDLIQVDSLSPIPQVLHESVRQVPSLIDPIAGPTVRRSECLLGRAGVLMQIKDRLLDTDGSPFIALYGLPGVGKTTLAATLARDPQVQARFSDGILWAPLGPQPHVLGLLTRWGMQLGVAPGDVENPESALAWSRALRAALGTRRMLLIIDDAWTAEDALALQIGGPQCIHLLTTRRPQIAFNFTQQCSIVVSQLEEADGLALLSRYVPQLIQQDPQGAQALVQALNCLPLALTLMGKCLVSLTLTHHSYPLQVALTQLHNIQDRLRLTIPTALEQSHPCLIAMAPFNLYGAIAMAVRQLSQEALATLSVLSLFPPNPHSFSEEAALVVSQQSKEMLDSLWEAGLVECWEQGRYSLHQTVAHYVRAMAKFQRHHEDRSALRSQPAGA